MDGVTDTIMTRRRFLEYSIAAGLGAVVGSGCAVNPVTGKNQLMMVSEEYEINIDKEQSPHQLSSDYGIVQDKSLNSYLDDVGRKLVPHTHRVHMPYAFHCVNATYINAYAFPGGSIAVTRGILLKIENEAELAALLGHELGHVNARHSAEKISKGTVSSMIVGGMAAAIGSQSAQLGDVAQQLGMLGQGALLASYSRDNEREADALGNDYMVKSGYSTRGFVGLMAILNELHTNKPSSAELLFSTHPMGKERYDAAVERSRGAYLFSKDFPLGRERYMDNTAFVRRDRKLIEILQAGESLMGKNAVNDAEVMFNQALKLNGDDYTTRLMLAKCLAAKEAYAAAVPHLTAAQRLYPEESQAYYLSGVVHVGMKLYDTAYQQFDRANEILPGNPTIDFFMGFSREGMADHEKAANHYKAYLGKVQQGNYAEHAYKRLKEWDRL